MNNDVSNKKIDYNRFLNFLNKWFYSFWFPVVLIILIYLLEKYMINNLIISIVVYILIIVFWIVKLVYVPKNKSKKFGIIFLIDNNTYYNDNRNLFFKKLNSILENHFKILVVNKNCIKKYDTETKREKIIGPKNYQMLINTFAMDVKDNNDCICSLDNQSVTFLSPVPELDKITINNLKKDLNNGFHKIIKLRQKAAYTDITENSDLMANSIRYLVSIIFIIFGDLLNAKTLLDEMNLSNLSPDNKIVQYLRKGIVRRYIDIYFAYASIIISKKEYLYNEIKLKELEENINMLEKLIQSNCSNKNYLIDFYDKKSKLLFAQTNYYASLGYVVKLDKKIPNDYIVLLSLGFMHINNGNIPKGVEYYKKVSKRKDVDIKTIDECIEFIKLCFKTDRYNNVNLNICLGLLTFYWKDEKDGIEILKSVLCDLESQENKKYIELRYIK